METRVYPRLADRLTVVSVKSKNALPDTTVAVPRIQLGLYKMGGRQAQSSVGRALETGYRGFDCAQMYFNERETGLAIKNFLISPQNRQGLRREDIFYTSKLAENETSYDAVKRSIAESVEACGLGYIDLFLLHSPYGGKKARLTSWKALEDAVLEGKVRAAGVSNYGVAHIEELMKAVEESDSGVKPVINQIEVHPFNTQTGIRDTCKKHGIEIEAYAPLVAGMRMEHPKIASLAKKYECTPAQLLVGWSLQHGMVTLPKTSQYDRLRENADVSSLKISEEDMSELDALDERLVTDWDPTECK